MTDEQKSTELDIVRDEPSREVTRADTDSWIGVVGQVSQFAAMVAQTEFVPASMRDKPAAVAAAILYGREVGLPPMTALTQTHVIEGRPSMSAEAMRALVLAAGHEVQILESTGARCVVRGRRRGSETFTSEVVWTMDMARAAGLDGKTNWKKWPRRMLQARATSELCELYFPDVVHGFRSIEEMIDVAEGDVEDPTTTVQRTTRKRAAKKATPPAPAASRPQEVDDGPPLPGEEPAADKTSAGGTGGEATAPPADTDAAAPGSGPPDSPDPEPSPEQDVHDGEIVEDEPAAPAERRANRAQIRALFKGSERFDIKDDERHRVASAILNKPVASYSDLTGPDVSSMLDTLSRLATRADLDALIEAHEATQSGRADA